MSLFLRILNASRRFVHVESASRADSARAENSRTNASSRGRRPHAVCFRAPRPRRLPRHPRGRRPRGARRGARGRHCNAGRARSPRGASSPLPSHRRRFRAATSSRPVRSRACCRATQIAGWTCSWPIRRRGYLLRRVAALRDHLRVQLRPQPQYCWKRTSPGARPTRRAPARPRAAARRRSVSRNGQRCSCSSPPSH